MFKMILFGMASFMLSGCAHFWIMPKFSGTTLNSAGKPIADVCVFWLKDGKSEWVTKTDSAGFFSIAGKKESVFFIFGDPMIKGSFVFKKDDYKEKSIEFSYGTGAVVGDDPPDLLKIERYQQAVVLYPI